MQLLSVSLARSLWFCHVRDFNPKGLNLYTIIIPLLVSSYKFKIFPSVKDVLDETKGVKFENGEFVNSKGDSIIINLSIYADGLVADTISSTDDSDAFLTDILTRLSDELNLPHYDQIIRRRGYFSQLYISTDKPMELINPKLKEISNYLSKNVLGGEVSFELGGISFWPDQANILKPSPFTFERVLNVSFSENRYYSGASLQTEEHLKLLDILETILSGN